MNVPSTVIELRQYTLRRGRRDELITLFERHFIESQHTVGAQVLGMFRDLDDPDRFVWLRGFRDLDARRSALESFYGGPVWKEHRDAANATMVDSDNVLLLRPAATGSGLPVETGRVGRSGVLRVSVHALRGADGDAFDGFFRHVLEPRIAVCGGQVLARYVTEPRPNSFPRLPVRGPDTVFVWATRFGDVRAEREFAERLRSEVGWRDDAPAEVLPAFATKPEVLRLSPTARSMLR